MLIPYPNTGFAKDTTKGSKKVKISGKVYFNAWSMDVKVEGKNVVRHMDLTTHNHGSFPGNSPTWPYIDSMAFEGQGPCKDVAGQLNDHCVERVKKTGGDIHRLP